MMKKPYEIIMEQFGVEEIRAKEVSKMLASSFREEDHLLDGEDMLERNIDILPPDFKYSELLDSDIAYLDIIYEEEIAKDVDEGYIEQTTLKKWLKYIKDEKMK